MQSYFSWLSDIDARVSFIIVQAPDTSASFSWSAIIPTVIGGGIALLTALAMFYFSNSLERKKREEERIRNNASSAVSGFLKLTRWANLVANVDEHINKFYEEANAHGHEADQAFQIVGPSVGKFLEPDRLTVEEYSFLLSKEHSELIGKIQMVEERAANLLQLLDQYSSDYLEFSKWLHTVPGFSRELDGPIAKSKIPKKYMAQVDEHGAQLNRILAGITEHIGEDLVTATQVIQEYGQVAHDEFKPYIEKLSFEYPSIST
ncbi:hypothetical protein [Parasedimentitalea marina]|uniref:hypothetical protein n=1 Tax=Parasedimentitalea marina TaxID=2483033 RepID=UPI000FD83C88|nr:hypothetical protein [Parasedimentitalea marina]